MGLPAALLRVAELIGADNFLAMWRELDAEPSYHTDKAISWSGCGLTGHT